MTVSDARQELLRDLFATIDGRDADRFVEFLSPDAVFRFGSAPEVQGRAAIRETVAAFFETVAGVRHEVSDAVSRDGKMFCEGEVTYTRHDGSTIALPFADAFELADGRISAYRIYMDINPLYAG